MNIVVCVKQVPSDNNAKVDEVTGVMLRSSADTKLNPFDLFGVETALSLKTQCDKVIAISMGPPSAMSALKECIYMGVDDGILISDRAFAGSDVLATSYTISQAFQTLSADLVICGKQTTDGDTAQVGAEVSEFLNFSYASNVSKILSCDDNSITVESNLGDAVQILKLNFPCLISVEKDISTPRLPSYKNKLAFGNRILTTLTLKDFSDSDENNYGLKGSPTQVERIFPPKINSNRVSFDEKDACESIFSLLKERKFI